MEISPIAGSFLFTPIPGYRGALESVIIPTSEGRPRDASTAMMAGDKKVVYMVYGIAQIEGVDRSF